MRVGGCCELWVGQLTAASCGLEDRWTYTEQCLVSIIYSCCVLSSARSFVLSWPQSTSNRSSVDASLIIFIDHKRWPKIACWSKHFTAEVHFSTVSNIEEAAEDWWSVLVTDREAACDAQNEFPRYYLQWVLENRPNKYRGFYCTFTWKGRCSMQISFWKIKNESIEQNLIPTMLPNTLFEKISLVGIFLQECEMPIPEIKNINLSWKVRDFARS